MLVSIDFALTIFKYSLSRFHPKSCARFALQRVPSRYVKARAVIPVLRKFTVARLLEPSCELGRTWAEQLRRPDMENGDKWGQSDVYLMCI